MDSLLESFADYLVYERRLSPNTCEAYRRDLNCFADFIRELDLKDWSEVTPHHVRRFIWQLSGRKYSPKSTQRMLSAVRSFYNFLLRRKQVGANPVEGLRGPKPPKRLPSVLGVDEMEALLKLGDDDPLSVRDLAIMELFYSSGLRLSELADLMLDKLNLNDAMVRVTGKGNKTRDLPLGNFAVTALRRWLDLRGQWAEGSEQAVFVSKRGTRMSVRAIQQRMAHWGLKQGVNGRLHPHRFRHSFASHLLESSGDIRAVQELLGHANLSTTQIYTHLDFQHLAQVYDQAHPRAKKATRKKE